MLETYRNLRAESKNKVTREVPQKIEPEHSYIVHFDFYGSEEELNKLHDASMDYFDYHKTEAGFMAERWIRGEFLKDYLKKLQDTEGAGDAIVILDQDDNEVYIEGWDIVRKLMGSVRIAQEDKEKIQEFIDKYAPEVKVISIEMKNGKLCIQLSHPIYYKIQEQYLDLIRDYMDTKHGKGGWNLDWKEASKKTAQALTTRQQWVKSLSDQDLKMMYKYDKGILDLNVSEDFKNAVESSLELMEKEMKQREGKQGSKKTAQEDNPKLAARTIGKENIRKVKELMEEAMKKGIIGAVDVKNYVLDKLPIKIITIWEGGEAEIERLVWDNYSEIDAKVKQQKPPWARGSNKIFESYRNLKAQKEFNIRDIVELIDPETNVRLTQYRGRIEEITPEKIKVRWPDGHTSEETPDRLRVFKGQIEAQEEEYPVDNEETFKNLIEDMKREVEEKRKEKWDSQEVWKWADDLGYGSAYRMLITEIGEEKAEEIERRISKTGSMKLASAWNRLIEQVINGISMVADAGGTPSINTLERIIEGDTSFLREFITVNGEDNIPDVSKEIITFLKDTKHPFTAEDIQGVLEKYITDDMRYEREKFITRGSKKMAQNIGIPEEINFKYFEGEKTFGKETIEYQHLEELKEENWQEYLDAMATTGVTVEYNLVEDQFNVRGLQASKKTATIELHKTFTDAINKILRMKGMVPEWEFVPIKIKFDERDGPKFGMRGFDFEEMSGEEYYIVAESMEDAKSWGLYSKILASEKIGQEGICPFCGVKMEEIHGRHGKGWECPECGYITTIASIKVGQDDSLSKIKDIVSGVDKYYTIDIAGNSYDIPKEKETKIINDKWVYLSDKDFLERYSELFLEKPFEEAFTEDNFDKEGHYDESLSITQTYEFVTKDNGKVVWDFSGHEGTEIGMEITEESSQANELKGLLEEYVGPVEDIDSLFEKLPKKATKTAQREGENYQVENLLVMLDTPTGPTYKYTGEIKISKPAGHLSPPFENVVEIYLSDVVEKEGYRTNVAYTHLSNLYETSERISAERPEYEINPSRIWDREDPEKEKAIIDEMKEKVPNEIDLLEDAVKWIIENKARSDKLIDSSDVITKAKFHFGKSWDFLINYLFVRLMQEGYQIYT